MYIGFIMHSGVLLGLLDDVNLRSRKAHPGHRGAYFPASECVCVYRLFTIKFVQVSARCIQGTSHHWPAVSSMPACRLTITQHLNSSGKHKTTTKYIWFSTDSLRYNVRGQVALHY